MKYNCRIFAGPSDSDIHEKVGSRQGKEGKARQGRQGAYAQKWCMRKHCQGQQGKCPQCAKNIQCCALFLTSLAVCSVYSSKQNKARTQAESWATVIFTSLLLACSLAQFWLPRRLTLPVRAWPWFRGKLMLVVSSLHENTLSGGAWAHEEGWELTRTKSATWPGSAWYRYNHN